jgi:hypothetical protein
MPSNVVRATLLADARKYQAGFRDAEQATSKFEGGVSKTASLVKGLLAGAAAAAVAAFAKDSIRAFSDLEQSIGSVESVFGSAADSITDKARGAANQYGLAASEFNQSSALIGAQLKNQLGLNVDEAAGKTQELIGKASDLAATFGGTTADAIGAIGSLLRGERDPIERYGVSINDAAIQARALELGLADASGEVDKTAKATAALDLLNEQTADSTGQFAREADTLAGKQQRVNARLENTKALLGQALAPAMSGALDLTGHLTTALSDLALSMLVARGEITGAEKALIQYEEATGRAVESTEDFVGALIEEGLHLERIAGGKGGFIDAAAGADAFGRSVSDALDVLDPGIEVADEWRATIEATGRELGLERDQIDAAKAAFEDYIIAEGNAARDAGRHQKDHKELGSAIGEVGDEATEARTALEKYEDEVRSQVDPLFALLDAEEKVAEAQQAVTDAAAQFTTDSPEWRKAVRDLAREEYDLKAAQLAVAEQSGLTRAEFSAQLRGMGTLTEEMINAILADFDRIQSYSFRAKTIKITHQVTGGGPQRQHGGPVAAGQPYLVGERGPEMMIPAGSGNIVPTGRLGQHRGGGPAAGPVVINVTALDPQAAARAVIQAIQAYERANGTAWRGGV